MLLKTQHSSRTQQAGEPKILIDSVGYVSVYVWAVLIRIAQASEKAVAF